MGRCQRETGGGPAGGCDGRAGSRGPAQQPGAGCLLIPARLVLPLIPLSLGALVISVFFNTTWNVSVITFRQTRIPPQLMGRVGAAGRVIGYGALPVGSLLGGLLGQILSARLGERTGLALALVIAALVAGSSALTLLGGRNFNAEGRPALIR